MYDSFESLPAGIQSRINTLIEPSDPEAWVKAPIQTLNGRSFLDVINTDGGQEAVTQYFERVEAFERPTRQSGAPRATKVPAKTRRIHVIIRGREITWLRTRIAHALWRIAEVRAAIAEAPGTLAAR